MNIFKKIKLNKNHKMQKGFVLLFAVVLSAIILSISLGLSEISYKQISFGNQARETADAFFAADAGLECALFYDIKGAETEFGDRFSPFGYDGTSGTMTTLQCARNNFVLNDGIFSQQGHWNFVLPNLMGQSCAIVLVDKTSFTGKTRIVSKGYNVGNENCTGNYPNRVEREIEIRYDQ